MTIAISVGLAFAAIIGACLFVLWYGSATVIDRQGETLTEHTEQLATLAYQMPALLEFLGVEIPPPVVDDSPAAEQVAGPTGSSPTHGPLTPVRASDDSVPPDDAKTDEFPAVPVTEPDGIAIQVQSALLRPSPVPRDLSGEFPHPVDSDERKAKNAADIEERLKQFDFTGGRK